MKVIQISKLFDNYLSGMEWGLSMSKQGITEVPTDCPAVRDRMKILNSWQDLQERASSRKNKTQARMIAYLLDLNCEKLLKLRDEIIQTLVAHGHADKVKALGFNIDKEVYHGEKC